MKKKSFILCKWKTPFICNWQEHACIFPEADSVKDGIHFLWNLSILLNYIIRLLLLALRGKENSYCKLVSVCSFMPFEYMELALFIQKQNAHIQNWTCSDNQMAMLDIRKKDNSLLSELFVTSKTSISNIHIYVQVIWLLDFMNKLNWIVFPMLCPRAFTLLQIEEFNKPQEGYSVQGLAVKFLAQSDIKINK